VKYSNDISLTVSRDEFAVALLDVAEPILSIVDRLTGVVDFVLVAVVGVYAHRSGSFG
jgi:hypothetical protein